MKPVWFFEVISDLEWVRYFSLSRFPSPKTISDPSSLNIHYTPEGAVWLGEKRVCYISANLRVAGSWVIAATTFASGKTSAKVCGNEFDKQAHTRHQHTPNNETLRTRWCPINRMDAESRSPTPLSKPPLLRGSMHCVNRCCSWLSRLTEGASYVRDRGGRKTEKIHFWLHMQ